MDSFDTPKRHTITFFVVIDANSKSSSHGSTIAHLKANMTQLQLQLRVEFFGDYWVGKKTLFYYTMFGTHLNTTYIADNVNFAAAFRTNSYVN